MKYVYPVAIQYEPEETGNAPDYAVYIPDFVEGGATQGTDVTDALAMAEDWLALMIDQYEKEKKELPAPSSLEDVQKAFPDATVSLILVDPKAYLEQMNRSVKKTLSIPAWLNERAIQNGINFSQTLQDALIEQIG